VTAVDELAGRFLAFGGESTTRAPLYHHLAEGVAADPELVALLLHAPPEQHQPVLLFAAVHFLLLDGRRHELARYYPNLTALPRPAAEAFPVFRQFVLDHADEVAGLVAARSTQTNEVGRCATFLPALGLLAAEVGDLALVDVGTSAGLNLQLDRYSYEYVPGGAVGLTSTVHLSCGTRGPVPIPPALPTLCARAGLDASPIDVLDDDAVRWLEACVWPDQPDRFERLKAAIVLVRDDPPTIRRGDAVDDLAVTVESVAGRGHPVVTNSWVLNYLSEPRRRDYVAALDALGAQLDLSWIAAESPAQTVGLPIPTNTTSGPEHRTVLSLTTWRQGRRVVRRLATCHPHGYWIHWEPASDGSSRPHG
jgi:hypothetical protein